MEKIKIGENEQLYEIRRIQPISENVLQIVFFDGVPLDWGNIILYTADGIEADTLTGYETVYRNEGKTIYLSNNGCVYTPPTQFEPIEPPAPYTPTLEETKSLKRAEVNTACETTIVAGIDVELSGGVEHFDLKEKDQLNLFGKQIWVTSGAESIEYHTDTNPPTNCKYYSNTDMRKIIEAALEHVSYNQTYCISLKVWIEDCETIDEVSEIFYGADIPEKYKSEVLNTYLATRTTV